jgi:hypothetical protein
LTHGGAALTDAERVGLLNTLVAYAGTYKMSGSKVTIHMEANTVPGPGRTYTMEISGNKLTLTADNPFVNSRGEQIISIRTFARTD